MTLVDVSSPRDWKILNGATSQADRLAETPAPENVQVDGRSVPQLLAFAARYGALILFYGLDDRPDGDWSAFFANDPAIANAVRGALDLPAIAADLRRLLAVARDADDPDRRAALLRRVQGMIVRLLCIHDCVTPQGADDHAAQLAWFAQAPRRDVLAAPLSQLHRHIQRRSSYDDRAQDSAWFDSLIEFLEDLLAELIAALDRGAAAALAASEASLHATGHAPQAALWNAFVMLFDEARQEMNRFPRRLLDFYYGDVLHQDSNAAQPDTVFLTFTLAQGATTASIPKQAPFSAGTDATGAPIAYLASTSLAVSPVTINKFRVHRYTYAADGTPNGVWSGTVAAPGTSDPAAFPLFGAVAKDAGDSLTMTPAGLGFVVASPALTLAGGSRVVQIFLTLPPDITQRPRGTPFATQLATLMQGAFDLSYSTPGGWISVQAFTVTASAAGVVFSFTLPADAPPVLAASTQPAPGAPKPTLPQAAFPDPLGQPTIVAQLNASACGTEGGAPTEAFAILATVQVIAIDVGVTVTGMPAPSLANRGGPIDQTQSFAVFGQAPAQFDALEISAPELFVKTLDSLSVSIAWAGLPVTATGFDGYYKGYVLDADGNMAQAPLFTNASFQVAFSVVPAGLWTVDTTTQPYLFQTAPPPGGTPPPPPGGTTATPPGGTTPAPDTTPPLPSTPVLPTSVLTVPGVAAQTPPTYYNPSASVLRLALMAPNYAFGNVLYASNVTKASADNIAALRGGGPSGATGGSGGAAPLAQSTAAAQVAQAATVNATAPDRGYAKSIRTAVEQAISALNGHGFSQLLHAVSSSGATPAAKSAWQQSLNAVINGSGSVWSRLWAGLQSAFGHSGPGTVTADLKAWVTAHENDLLALGGTAVTQARAALTAAESMAATLASGKQSIAASRTAMAATLQQAMAATGPTNTVPTTAGTTTIAPVIVPLPNPPWLPTASAVTLGYTAYTNVTKTPPATKTPPPQLQSLALMPAAVAEPPQRVLDGQEFLHLSLFDMVAPAIPRPRAPSAATSLRAPPSVMQLLATPPMAETLTQAEPIPGTPLLPVITGQAALYIEFSAATDAITLLFVLTAGPNGWSNETAAPKSQKTPLWEKQIGTNWLPIDVLGDTTNGLQNSGIVTLRLAASADARNEMAQTVRVVQTGTTENMAYVTSVTTNALAAVWAGPGGAATLGDPLPVGTITQSVNTISGLGTVAQPMESIGGAPVARGRSFDQWMAERLRHKGFGIDAWDYARLVLASIPSLWQVAVVPPDENGSGGRPPGEVWVVAVPGRKTPNVSDTTIPTVATGVLGEIGDLLQPVISPFITLNVTNPPYLRLTVHATLAFSDADTPGFWIARLQDELVRWLSPWPDPTLGVRPPDYTSRQAVAEFVRGRFYVLGILSLRVVPERDPGQGRWHYLTSALQHRLCAAHAPADQAEEAAT